MQGKLASPISLCWVSQIWVQDPDCNLTLHSNMWTAKQTQSPGSWDQGSGGNPALLEQLLSLRSPPKDKEDKWEKSLTRNPQLLPTRSLHRTHLPFTAQESLPTAELTGYICILGNVVHKKNWHAARETTNSTILYVLLSRVLHLPGALLSVCSSWSEVLNLGSRLSRSHLSQFIIFSERGV